MKIDKNIPAPDGKKERKMPVGVKEFKQMEDGDSIYIDDYDQRKACSSYANRWLQKNKLDELGDPTLKAITARVGEGFRIWFKAVESNDEEGDF